MKTKKIQMTRERETKGTVVYREVDSSQNIIENNRDCVVGPLYIQKTAGISAANINVTIEEV